MRHAIIIFLSAVLLFSCSRKKDTVSLVSDFNDLAAYFKDPPASFRTQPFWVWNDSITKEQIDEQLADYKKKGFGGLFIHPRYGLVAEYLGKEWFELYRYATEKAKKLGLEIWIYDENSFPSGFAGGLVPAQMPESYNQGQGLSWKTASILKPEPGKIYPFIFRKEKKQWKDITADTARYKGKKGEFALVELTFYERSKWYAGFSYVDLLKPGVTEKFIEVTMSGYEKNLGPELGNTIKGTFTDEPNINPPGRNAVRFTPDLFDEFKKQWGYDLRIYLPGLFEETGDWMRVRHNYQSTLLRLFIERWSVPWNKYSVSKKLIWTGHYWEHGWPWLADGPDNMAMYEYHQMPGIDMLFNTIDQEKFPVQFGNIRAVKELSSIANQLGKKRTLSETYGASGWELTFNDMKRLGDWEYVLGVNFMNQHLSYMSVAGDRKHDFPQSFSYHTPWWDLYKVQSDYFGRLSLALSSGDQVNRILVIEPTTTAWMYYKPGRNNPLLDSISRSFHQLLAGLEKYQIEYDLGCENSMKNNAKVEGNRLVVGNRSYNVVILPPFTRNLDKPVRDLLKQYLSSGGKLVAVGARPDRTDGTSDQELAAFPVVFAKQWIAVPALPDEALLPLLREKECWFENPGNITGTLYHMRRILSDGQLLFLVNTHHDQNARGTVHLKGSYLYELDALSGKIFRYPAQTEDTMVRVSFSLPPSGSLLLFASNKKHIYPVRKFVPETMHPLPVIYNKPARLSPNVIALDYCTLHLSGKPDTFLYFYSAGDMIWQAHGFPDNPWVSSSQFKKQLVESDTFSPGTGFSVSYPFKVEKGTSISNMKAVVERPWLWKVSVNGKEVKPIAGQWWLDKRFGVYDISQAVVPGKNILGLSISPMRIFAEIEPVYILGDFSVWPDTSGFFLAPSVRLEYGPWKTQGLPFYADRISYSGTFNLQKKTKNIQIQLKNWNGTVAEVKINGKSAGVIFSPPYVLSLENWCKKGENKVEVIVYGSLKNLLGPFHFVRQRGIVTPWSFKYAPAVQPSGNQYDQLDYGLNEEFVIAAGQE